MAYKGHAANKKGPLKTKKRTLQTNLREMRCKQKSEPLETKKQNPQRREEELRNLGDRCNKENKTH